MTKREFEKRPRRKGYRPYRNRAVIYTLIETGMRRAAVCNIDLDDVDFQKRMLPAQEKGGDLPYLPDLKRGDGCHTGLSGSRTRAGQRAMA